MLSLDRLEPDKDKQARLFTEPLTCQKTLPCTERELQIRLEMKVAPEIKRFHGAAEAAANKTSTYQLEAHTAAMAAHLT